MRGFFIFNKNFQMNYKSYSIIAFFFTLNLLAQSKAVTETGETVLLYNDGTWVYEDQSANDVKEIALNPEVFTKDEASNFLVKSRKADIGVYLNPKQWSFKKAEANTEAEYEFQHKQEDIFGMLISEKLEIPLETMKVIALENGQEVAPDLKIVKQEYRNVNGIKVLLLQMDGTMQGIKFSYYGYYYSNETGTVQLITYTAQNLMASYRPFSETLLNGLVKLE